jgi:hypothetical protein
VEFQIIIVLHAINPRSASFDKGKTIWWINDLSGERRPQKAAQYFGNANHGLGFLHVEVDPKEDKPKLWSASDNYGVRTIEEGAIQREDVVHNLRRMFDKDWVWKLRPLYDYRYMIRFSPSKRVENMVMGDVIWFPLNKHGVMDSLKVWDGEINPMCRLVAAWVQVRGVPPK